MNKFILSVGNSGIVDQPSSFNKQDILKADKILRGVRIGGKREDFTKQK